MRQKLAQKEKESKEENLRMLAQRAREERGGLAPPKPTAASASRLWHSMGATAAVGQSQRARVARRMRRRGRFMTRCDVREREMRMSNMNQEQRARQQNRDSEKIALGLAKPTMLKESMLDLRLFNQESLSGSFADDESYNLYDRPLFHGSKAAAAAIYKARGNIAAGNEDLFGGGTEEGIGKALDNDRFGLGPVRVGFEGAKD
jgi:SNW domain-containing protein 1